MAFVAGLPQGAAMQPILPITTHHSPLTTHHSPAQPLTRATTHPEGHTKTMADSTQKVAIVTGSTQGLGEAIARRLVDDALIGGLVICGRNAEGGERLVR